ncbi:hypothetical protein C453_16999 [Haloferax elongans ATCC BAA-1513]|uniref:Uncharacterized protein n=1 Tax=Haloferax elongans ATCC BAA-1513 TaxID=1230453 RepID=M0HF67_HALEO|nr:hypothetical protein [Haloferax elongans]ELZ81734.1 hypothetical protein C453_16999 [Haloferax elongans ATCC BAA-1513]
MASEIEVPPHVVSEGSTIRHATLCEEHVVTELTEEIVRTERADGTTFVYPRSEIALALSMGRFEIVSS